MNKHMKELTIIFTEKDFNAFKYYVEYVLLEEGSLQASDMLWDLISMRKEFVDLYQGALKISNDFDNLTHSINPAMSSALAKEVYGA
jgi:hypothetical protein